MVTLDSEGEEEEQEQQHPPEPQLQPEEKEEQEQQDTPKPECQPEEEGQQEQHQQSEDQPEPEQESEPICKGCQEQFGDYQPALSMCPNCVPHGVYHEECWFKWVTTDGGAWYDYYDGNGPFYEASPPIKCTNCNQETKHACLVCKDILKRGAIRCPFKNNLGNQCLNLFCTAGCAQFSECKHIFYS